MCGSSAARFQRGREAQSNRKGALLLVIKAQAELLGWFFFCTTLTRILGNEKALFRQLNDELSNFSPKINKSLDCMFSLWYI